MASCAYHIRPFGRAKSYSQVPNSLEVAWEEVNSLHWCDGTGSDRQTSEGQPGEQAIKGSDY